MSTLVDANTNRLSGFGYSYDGNGNLLTMPQQSASMTYDGSNRMVTFTNQNDTESYQYAPDNKRVWRSKGCSYQSVVDGSTQVAPALTFYSVFGQKLGDYCYPPGGGQVVEENVHFGGRIVAKGDAGGSLAALATDRLHSKGDGSTFFPYGETKSGTAITGDSFATYSRDWSGLDYADQRWYAPGVRRFTTVDPYYNPSPKVNPTDWNRYAYAGSEPNNAVDSAGLARCYVVSYSFGYYGNSAEAQCISDGGTVFESAWINIPLGDPLDPTFQAYVTDLALATLGFAVDEQERAKSASEGSFFLLDLNLQWDLNPDGSGTLGLFDSDWAFLEELQLAPPVAVPVIVIGGRFLFRVVTAIVADQIIQVLRSRAKNDPIRVNQTETTQRDDNGDCIRPPQYKWTAAGNAHGSMRGFHWHWIEWLIPTNSFDCTWYSKRRSGANDPGPAFILIGPGSIMY